jgi:hypothetical protein
MKRRSKWLISILSLLAVPLLIFGAGQIDFQRMLEGKKPLFAGFATHYEDGGSVEYIFLGYTVTNMARLTDREDGVYVTAGPVLEYWIPGLRREQTSVRKKHAHAP